MRIENPSRSTVVSDVLAATRDLFKTREGDLQIEAQTDTSKGELIIALTALVIGVGSNALYECLKLAARRIIQARESAKKEIVVVDGSTQTLESLSGDK